MPTKGWKGHALIALLTLVACASTTYSLSTSHPMEARIGPAFGRVALNEITVANTSTLELTSTTTITIAETSAIPGGHKFYVWWGYFEWDRGDIIVFQTNGLVKVTDPHGETAYQGGETSLKIEEAGTYRVYITVGHGMLLYIRIYRVTSTISTSTIVSSYVLTTTYDHNAIAENSSSTTIGGVLNNTQAANATATIASPIPGFQHGSVTGGLIIGWAAIALIRRLFNNRKQSNKVSAGFKSLMPGCRPQQL